MNPPLLLFRLYKIDKHPHWSIESSTPVPEGCAAIAVSGGMADLWERRRGQRRSEPDENGISAILTPFLRSASKQMASRIVWALLGPGGRFYPMYRTSPFALRLHGFGSSVPSGSKLDVLASPKFQSPQAAEGVDWHSDFLTCFSDGLGLGFWGGEPTKLERKLKKAEDFSPFQRVGEMVMESTAQRMEDVHPYLHAKWQECGFEWLLQDVDLVVRPWGWEGEDAVFLSTKMSHDQMAQAIRRELGNELQISEYDGDDEYRRWQMWHPNRTNEVDHWL